VKAVVEKIPGIETADYEVAEVEHTVEALTKLFKGAEVVSNMVGPFIKFGPEVVEACPNGLGVWRDHSSSRQQR
jgi:short subunit dehydrogenase-like uncharacterized protein